MKSNSILLNPVRKRTYVGCAFRLSDQRPNKTTDASLAKFAEFRKRAQRQITPSSVYVAGIELLGSNLFQSAGEVPSGWKTSQSALYVSKRADRDRQLLPWRQRPPAGL